MCRRWAVFHVIRPSVERPALSRLRLAHSCFTVGPRRHFYGAQGSAADIIANLLTGTGFPPIGDLYHDADSVSSLVATFVPLQLDNTGFAQGSSTGTLGPGTYRFFFDNVIRDGLGGSGSGNFKLTLTAQGIPSVPEAGWTLALICMALCTLGGFARCCKVG
jgi:hypothetical protein